MIPLPHRCTVSRPGTGLDALGAVVITPAFVASAVPCFIQGLSIGQRMEYERAHEQITNRVYFATTQDIRHQDVLAPTAHPMGSETLLVQAVTVNDRYKVADCKQVDR